MDNFATWIVEKDYHYVILHKTKTLPKGSIVKIHALKNEAVDVKVVKTVNADLIGSLQRVSIRDLSAPYQYELEPEKMSALTFNPASIGFTPKGSVRISGMDHYSSIQKDNNYADKIVFAEQAGKVYVGFVNKSAKVNGFKVNARGILSRSKELAEKLAVFSGHSGPHDFIEFRIDPYYQFNSRYLPNVRLFPLRIKPGHNPISRMILDEDSRDVKKIIDRLKKIGAKHPEIVEEFLTFTSERSRDSQSIHSTLVRMRRNHLSDSPS